MCAGMSDDRKSVFGRREHRLDEVALCEGVIQVS